jgi:Porin subfamily
VLTEFSPAGADELAEARAGMELLQRRIDQLAQAPVPGAAPGQPVVAGSFPRSFLIPGTDTSLRIGGIAWTDVLWYIKGALDGTQLNGQGGLNNQSWWDGPGGAGNLNNIPLNNSITHSKSQAFDISPRVSRLLFDTHTPTAWGEVKAYIEFDFVQNTNTVQNNQMAVDSGFLPRLRKAYATLGDFEAGQDTGVLHDTDADPEVNDLETGVAGRRLVPQLRYTFTGPYGSVFVIGAENPVPQLNGPFGVVFDDTNQIPTVGACSATGNTAANLPADTACLGNGAFLSPLQAGIMPEWIGTARTNQPWGHVQMGFVVRTDRLDDGQFLDRTFVGYGGTVSGDSHPFSGTPGLLGKDDFGFGVTAGKDIGFQLTSGTAVVTNFGTTIAVPGFGNVNPLTSAAWNTAGSPTRMAYDTAVRAQTSGSYGGAIWYQHWWTNELRSTIDISGNYNALNTTILPAGTINNKILALSHANLFWSPAAFIDFSIEYAWGHRVTVANFKGDSYTLEGSMRVRF